MVALRSRIILEENMDGIQKTVHLALKNLAANVKDGKYGRDDEFDGDAFINDVEDDIIRVTQ